jgi:hypothetical protein
VDLISGLRDHEARDALLVLHDHSFHRAAVTAAGPAR